MANAERVRILEVELPQGMCTPSERDAHPGLSDAVVRAVSGAGSAAWIPRYSLDPVCDRLRSSAAAAGHPDERFEHRGRPAVVDHVAGQ